MQATKFYIRAIQSFCSEGQMMKNELLAGPCTTCSTIKFCDFLIATYHHFNFLQTLAHSAKLVSKGKSIYKIKAKNLRKDKERKKYTFSRKQKKGKKERNTSWRRLMKEIRHIMSIPMPEIEAVMLCFGLIITKNFFIVYRQLKTIRKCIKIHMYNQIFKSWCAPIKMDNGPHVARGLLFGHPCSM